jgi:hypothetical protein
LPVGPELYRNQFKSWDSPRRRARLKTGQPVASPYRRAPALIAALVDGRGLRHHQVHDAEHVELRVSTMVMLLPAAAGGEASIAAVLGGDTGVAGDQRVAGRRHGFRHSLPSRRLVGQVAQL